MDTKMKIIAFYLPQFHEIPENNKWWGEGFTEWTNVKKAQPVFEGHRQPRAPLNHYYYNLLDLDALKWQADLANKYGIYGFCYYHYWFDGKMLLEKPMEMLLKHPEIDIHYCICWANEPWTKAWVSKDYEVIFPQTYGKKEDWEAHFEYFLQFFHDKRYIKNNNRPFLVIYRPSDIPCLKEMINCWRELALKNGFNGLDIAFQTVNFDLEKDKRRKLFDYDIEFQPNYAQMDMEKVHFRFLRKIKRKIDNLIFKKKGGKAIDFHNLLNKKKNKDGRNLVSYDELWKKVISRVPIDNKCIPGAFVDFDNSPRKGKMGSICSGSNPDKFKKYMTIQIQRTREVYNSDMLFVYAWNEWAEGGYLEPDEDYGYGYLEAIRDALKTNGYNVDGNDNN